MAHTPSGQTHPVLAADASQPLRDLVRFYETIKPDSLQQISVLYAPGVHFRDPFNDGRGVPLVHEIFADMFAHLTDPRFRITTAFESSAGTQPHQAFLTWDFDFGLRKPGMPPHLRVAGSSHLVFDDQGRVTAHHDYWDAAQGLYEHVPLLGGVLRRLRRRMATTPTGDPQG